MKKFFLGILIVIILGTSIFIGEYYETQRSRFPEEKVIIKEYRAKKSNDGEIKLYKNNDNRWISYNKRVYKVNKDKKFTEEQLKDYDKYSRPIIERIDGKEQSEVLNRKVNNEKVLKIVDNYKVPSNSSDLDIFKSIVKYISELNLNYSQKNPNNQINNIEKGYTACLGITWLQKQLLDKSEIEYKIVSFRPYDFKTDKIDYSNNGHIMLYVKLDGKWYKSDMSDLITGKSDDKIPYYGFVEEVLENEVDFKDNYYGLTFNYIKNNKYNDVIQIISPTMKNGKPIYDNGFVIKQRTDTFDEYLDKVKK